LALKGKFIDFGEFKKPGILRVKVKRESSREKVEGNFYWKC
jgi:hypothetical protein